MFRSPSHMVSKNTLQLVSIFLVIFLYYRIEYLVNLIIQIGVIMTDSAYQIRWVNTNKVAIELELKGEWTWTDWYDGFTKLQQTLKNSSHPVDVILNLTSTFRLPNNMISHTGTIVRNLRFRNANRLIFVTTDIFTITLLNVVKRMAIMSDKEFLIVPSMYEVSIVVAKTVFARQATQQINYTKKPQKFNFNTVQTKNYLRQKPAKKETKSS